MTDISILRSDPHNRRKHNPRNVGMIVDALHQVGAARSIVIDEDNTILAGNATIEAAAQAGIEKLQVVEADGQTIIAVRRRGLNAEQKRRLALYDNQTAAIAEWDAEQIAADLQEGLDFQGIFDQQEMADILASVKGDPPEDPGPQIDRAAELQEQWKTELGQLWELGEHRLICGDCTDRAVVERVMGGEKAGAVVTDPPFNVGFGYDGEYKGQDKKNPDEYKVFINAALSHIDSWLMPGSFVFVWQAATNVRYFSLWFAGQEWRVLAAAKGMVQFLPTPIQYSWDPIVFWQTPGESRVKPVAGKRDWFLSNKASWLQENNIKGHPCPRPLDAVEYVVGEFALFDDVVYEPFAGSGTTLIACERLGRKCRAIEISPGYVGVAIERWHQMTGRSPVLVD